MALQASLTDFAENTTTTAEGYPTDGPWNEGDFQEYEDELDSIVASVTAGMEDPLADGN